MVERLLSNLDFILRYSSLRLPCIAELCCFGIRPNKIVRLRSNRAAIPHSSLLIPHLAKRDQW